MVKASEEASYVEFVEGRQTSLRRMALAICGDWNRADDLLQNALVKLYGAWPRIHRHGVPEAYVRQIIVRTTIDETRRPWRRRERASEVAHADRPTPVQGVGTEERSELVAALQQLPEMQRKVVVLRYLYDLDLATTAAELRISVGTVKSHAHRGTAALREILDSPGEFSDAPIATGGS